MADNGKEINFTFKVDQQSLQQVTNAIQNVTKAFTQMNASMTGGTGGGNMPGVGGSGSGGQKIPQGGGMPSLGAGGGANKTIAQSFLDTIRIVKDLGKVSKESFSALKQVSKDAIDEQTRALTQNISSVKTLKGEYKALQDQIKAGGEAGAAARQALPGKARELAGTAYDQAGNELALRNIQKAQGQLDEIMNPTSSGFRMGPISGLGSLKQFGGLAAVGAWGFQEARSESRAMATSEARRAAAIKPSLDRLFSGDYKQISTMLSLNGQERLDLAKQAMGPGANMEAFMGGLGTTAKQGINAATGGLLSNILGSTSGSFGQSLSAADRGTARIEAFQQQMSSLENSGSRYVYNKGRDILASQQGAMISAQRTMGIRGLEVNGAFSANQFAEINKSLQKEGLTMGGMESAFTGLRGVAGSDIAHQYKRQLANIQASGYSGFENILASAGRRGNAGGAFSALGGGIDKSAGIALGQAILGEGFDIMGTTSGQGMLGAIQSGLGFSGTAADFNQVARAKAGMGALNSTLSGQLDPYQMAMNTLSAIRINPQGSTYSQDYLATGMNSTQMLDAIQSGQLTETAKQLGLSREQIKGQFGSSVGSVLRNRFVDEGATDPMSRALRSFQESGYEDVQGYLGTLSKKDRREAQKSLGVAYGLFTGTGEEAGLGALGITAGAGAAAGTGKIGGGISGYTKAVQEDLAEREKKALDAVTNMGELTMQSVTQAKDFFGQMHDVGANMDADIGKIVGSFTKVNDSAVDLGTTLMEIAKSLKYTYLSSPESSAALKGPTSWVIDAVIKAMAAKKKSP